MQRDLEVRRKGPGILGNLIAWVVVDLWALMPKLFRQDRRVLLLPLVLLGLLGQAQGATTCPSLSAGQTITASAWNNCRSALLSGYFWDNSGLGSKYVRHYHDGTNGYTLSSLGDYVVSAAVSRSVVLRSGSYTGAWVAELSGSTALWIPETAIVGQATSSLDGIGQNAGIALRVSGYGREWVSNVHDAGVLGGNWAHGLFVDSNTDVALGTKFAGAYLGRSPTTFSIPNYGNIGLFIDSSWTEYALKVGNAPSYFSGGVEIAGTLTASALAIGGIAGNFSIGGNLGVSGSAEVDGVTNLDGPVDAATTLQVHGGTGLSGSLEVDGITYLDAAQVNFGGGANVPATGHFRAIDGTSGSPSYSFASDQTTGMYRSSAGSVIIANSASIGFQSSSSGTKSYRPMSVGATSVLDSALRITDMAAQTGTTQQTVRIDGPIDTTATAQHTGLLVSQDVNSAVNIKIGEELAGMSGNSTNAATTVVGLSLSGALNGAGSTTNNYALWIPDQTAGTNRNPIYVADPDDPSTFIGGLRVGTGATQVSGSVSMSSTLAVSGNVGLTGSMEVDGSADFDGNAWFDGASPTVFTNGIKVKDTGSGSTPLRHYEEGTNTPRLYHVDGGYSDPSAGASRYTKVGKVINVSGNMVWNACTLAPCTGGFAYLDLQVGGVGYSAMNVLNYKPQCSLMLLNAAYTGPMVVIYIDENTDNANIYQISTAGSATRIPSDLSSNLSYSCTYRTD